jgi:hypothetical protein
MLLQLLERFGSPSVTAKETKFMLNMLLYLYKSSQVCTWKGFELFRYPSDCGVSEM